MKSLKEVQNMTGKYACIHVHHTQAKYYVKYPTCKMTNNIPFKVTIKLEKLKSNTS